MTNQERWNYYDSGILQREVAVKLIDWAGYWTNAGLDGITDNVKKYQMRRMINDILNDMSIPIKTISTIAMSYPSIKDAVVPTESDIPTVVDDILSFRLDWVTNIFPIDYAEEDENA